jgi:hypothetical protein
MDILCSNGNCPKIAIVVIHFIDGRKLPYCQSCALKIGGKQTPAEAK